MNRNPYKAVHRRTMTCVAENGDLDQQLVQLWLDPRGVPRFLYKIPAYVASNLGVDSEVSAPTADDAKHAYEKLMRRYSDWARTAAAEPVIVLQVSYSGLDPEGERVEEDAFFFRGHERYESEQCIGVRYLLAYRVNGELHDRNRDRTGADWHTNKKYKVGGRLHRTDGIVMDYSVELHARIDAICFAVSRAANQIHEIVNAKDVMARLLSVALPPLLESPHPTPNKKAGACSGSWMPTQRLGNDAVCPACSKTLRVAIGARSPKHKAAIE